MNNVVITIARGFGSGGKYIAKKLADELGIPCYDRQLLTLASQASGIDENLFVDMDEKLNGPSIMKKLGTIPFSGVLEPHERGFLSDNNLFNIQTEILKKLARTESFVVIGKCADYFLKDYPNVVSIYVEAPREACIVSIMTRANVDRERAEKMIVKTDKYRAQYYEYYTRGGDWTNPMNYDLTLNSYRIGRDRCVEVIKNYIDLKFQKEPGPEDIH